MNQAIKIAIEQFEQVEQVNGYFLISLTLQDELAFDRAIGKLFYISEEPDIKLTLFLHASQNNIHQYQFLSYKPFAKETFTRPGNLISSCDSSFIQPNPQQPLLILASDLAMANAFAIAKHRVNHSSNQSSNNRSNQNTNRKVDVPTIIALESNSTFPFTIKPARYLMPEMPAQAIGACTLLEDWKVQNRLVSTQGLPGCFDGDLSELFAYWVDNMQNQIESSEYKTWQVLLFSNKETQQKCQQISQNKGWLTMQAFDI